MSMRIATRSSTGLRAQAAGGQSVLDVFQTITHYLRRSLTDAHADLFAEPNSRGLGGDVDWYTPIESATGAVALGAVPEPQRATILARLAGLVNDVRSRAGELKNSPRQSDRLLGQLLQLAIEVPGEEYIYAIGDQPVLIFWGHLRDVPVPDSGIIDRMIARQAAAQSRVLERPPPADRPALSPGPTSVRAASAALSVRHRWLVPGLWAVLAALCIAIGLELLRGCGIGWPYVSSSLWVNYCPIPSNPNTAELADLEAQNAQLQSQLDQLLGHVAGRREQCAIASGPPKAPVPTPAPDTRPAPLPIVGFTVPNCEGQGCLGFLKGCWGPDRSRFIPDVSIKDVSEPDVNTYCFNDVGEGQFSLRSESGITCKGQVRATMVKRGELTIEQPGIDRCSNNRGFVGRTYTCTTDEKDETSCKAADDPDDQPVLRPQKGPAVP